MPLVSVTVEIGVPRARVWRALTSPPEVSQWDGVEPVVVPDGYPAAGQHALWRTRVGPLRLKLHDRISAVEPPTRMASTIDVAFVHVEEEYRLTETSISLGTRLVSENEVTSRIPGLDWFAVRVTRTGVSASMGRLKEFCERG